MDLRKLGHAVALARHLNFTKASQALGITQSALSRSIQSLEDDCGFKLFDRTRNMVAVTSSGKEFVRHAEAVLRKESELRDFANQSARGDGGSVALGMAPLASRLLLAPMMVDMIGMPGFHADVTIGSSKKLLAMLVEESVQLCVCTGQENDLPRSDPVLECVLLARFPLALVVRKGHPLCDRETVTPANIEAYPLLRSRPFDLEDDAANRISTLALRRPALSVEDYRTLLQTTLSTDAVWVTSYLSAREWLENGTLAQLPVTWLDETSHATMTAYRLEGRTMSPLMDRMWKRVIELGKSINDTTSAFPPIH